MAKRKIDGIGKCEKCKWSSICIIKNDIDGAIHEAERRKMNFELKVHACGMFVPYGSEVTGLTAMEKLEIETPSDIT